MEPLPSISFFDQLSSLVGRQTMGGYSPHLGMGSGVQVDSSGGRGNNNPLLSSDSPAAETSETDDNSEGESAKKRSRGNYKCSKCGMPKKGHICPYQNEGPPAFSSPSASSQSSVSGSGPNQMNSSAEVLNAFINNSQPLMDDDLMKRIQMLENENLLLQQENMQIRTRLINLGWGAHLAQLNQAHSQGTPYWESEEDQNESLKKKRKTM
jgi:hypothetical protein